MGKFIISVNDRLDDKFRKKLASKGLYKKGDISKQVEKLIQEWVSGE